MAVLHTENLDLQTDGGPVTGYLVRPDSDAPLPGVVVIQEWWGIEPHVREVAQWLAKEGFVVLVPDLFHGKVATEPNEAEKLLMARMETMAGAIKEIQAAVAALKARPDVEPKQIGVMGFCMGGLLAWKTALSTEGLGALVAFYPVMFDPSPEEVAPLAAPALTIYGDQDGWLPLEQIQRVEQTLNAAGKDVEVRVYHGAGHAFLNPDHGDHHADSAQDAWPRAVAFLQQHLTAHEE